MRSHGRRPAGRVHPRDCFIAIVTSDETLAFLRSSATTSMRRRRREGVMAHLLCLLRGHKPTPVVFTSARLYCQRCGLDLGGSVAPEPPPAVFPTAAKLKPRSNLRRHR